MCQQIKEPDPFYRLAMIQTIKVPDPFEELGLIQMYFILVLAISTHHLISERHVVWKSFSFSSPLRRLLKPQLFRYPRLFLNYLLCGVYSDVGTRLSQRISHCRTLQVKLSAPVASSDTNHPILQIQPNKTCLFAE